MHTKSLLQVLSEVVLVLVHLCLDMIYHVTYATFVLLQWSDCCSRARASTDSLDDWCSATAAATTEYSSPWFLLKLGDVVNAHETTVVDLIVMYFVIYFLLPCSPKGAF
ncbi:hypothetical protein HanPSC8_Chr04g0184191 [Helianthus annuus]|nr:hypothetical protein HanPSC8_Chr04g0184191 [Helianthus annuus]